MPLMRIPGTDKSLQNQSNAEVKPSSELHVRLRRCNRSNRKQPVKRPPPCGGPVNGIRDREPSKKGRFPLAEAGGERFEPGRVVLDRPPGEAELRREFTHPSTAIVETVWSVSLAAEGMAWRSNAPPRGRCRRAVHWRLPPATD